MTENQKGDIMILPQNQNTTFTEDSKMPLYVDCITGEVRSQEEIELKDGHRDWKKRKRMSLQVANLMQSYDPERAALIRSCGTYLEFLKIPDGTQKLHRANFCRQRLCPLCQWRRSIKLRAQADEIYRILNERGYKQVFVTLTVRNCEADDLTSTIKELYAAASRLKRSEIYRNAVRGAYRALEITYNADTNTFHPHFHLLWTVDETYFYRQNQDYIDHEKLCDAWQRAARLSYKPMVSIEGIKQKEGQTMTGACAEMCKYPTKSAEIHTAGVLEAIDFALRGRRLIEWSGVAADVRRELKMDDVETGNLIQTTETEGEIGIEKIIYIWRYGLYIPYDQQYIAEQTGTG